MEKETSYRIFLLSPAYAGGRRAKIILSDRAQFELARKLRGKTGATIAEVFTFLSGLYFRGKFAYATAFARSARGTPGVFVITPTRGLVDATREFTSKTCVNLPRSIFTRTIRATDCQSNVTRDAWQRSYRSKARSFFLGALPPANTWMFCWRLLARNFDSPRSSSVAAT